MLFRALMVRQWPAPMRSWMRCLSEGKLAEKDLARAEGARKTLRAMRLMRQIESVQGSDGFKEWQVKITSVLPELGPVGLDETLRLVVRWPRKDVSSAFVEAWLKACKPHVFKMTRHTFLRMAELGMKPDREVMRLMGIASSWEADKLSQKQLDEVLRAQMQMGGTTETMQPFMDMCAERDLPIGQMAKRIATKETKNDGAQTDARPSEELESANGEEDEKWVEIAPDRTGEKVPEGNSVSTGSGRNHKTMSRAVNHKRARKVRTAAKKTTPSRALLTRMHQDMSTMTAEKAVSRLLRAISPQIEDMFFVTVVIDAWIKRNDDMRAFLKSYEGPELLCHWVMIGYKPPVEWLSRLGEEILVYEEGGLKTMPRVARGALFSRLMEPEHAASLKSFAIQWAKMILPQMPRLNRGTLVLALAAIVRMRASPAVVGNQWYEEWLKAATAAAQRRVHRLSAEPNGPSELLKAAAAGKVGSNLLMACRDVASQLFLIPSANVDGVKDRKDLAMRDLQDMATLKLDDPELIKSWLDEALSLAPFPSHQVVRASSALKVLGADEAVATWEERNQASWRQ